MEGNRVMSIDSHDDVEDVAGTTSRRTALKLGVGAGVGAIAWTGPTITSLGGTPAYAAGCTFVTTIELIPCRNTDQGTPNCPAGPPTATHRYHKLKDTGLPTGYALINNLVEGTCCNDVATNPTLTFPAGITCQVELRFAGPGNCSGALVSSTTFGPSGTGSLVIGLDDECPSLNPNTQYSLIAKCNTTGAPPDCLN